MYELAERTGWSWLQVFNAIFSDDWLTHCPFENIAEFHQHVINIGHLSDFLEEYDLCINISKTVGLVKAAGPQLAQLNRRFLQKTKQGMFLKISRCNGEITLIQLQTQQVYLGVVINFGRYDTLTVRYRLQCARNFAHMLTRWLCGRHGLNLSSCGTNVSTAAYCMAFVIQVFRQDILHRSMHGARNNYVAS